MLQCSALVLCSKVLQHEGGGTSLIGLIRGFHAPSFPFVPKPCEVYLELWGAQGPAKITLKLSTSDGSYGQAWTFPIDLGVSRGPLATGFGLEELEFPREDDYTLTLLFEDHPVIQKRVPVDRLGAGD